MDDTERHDGRRDEQARCARSARDTRSRSTHASRTAAIDRKSPGGHRRCAVCAAPPSARYRRGGGCCNSVSSASKRRGGKGDWRHPLRVGATRGEASTTTADAMQGNLFISGLRRDSAACRRARDGRSREEGGRRGVRGGGSACRGTRTKTKQQPGRHATHEQLADDVAQQRG